MRLFPDLITRNWQLKISALGLAVLLWTVPELGKEGSQTLDDIPVRVQLNDPEWAMTQEPLPATVRITLSGPSRNLFALGLDRPSIVIPIDQVGTPDTAVLLRSQWVRMAVGQDLVVKEMVPNLVNLSFEPMAVGPVTLRPRLTAALPMGLSLSKQPEVTPELARVSGPRGRVEGLESISLVALDLSLVQRSGDFSLPVDTVGLSGMAFSPQTGTLHIEVEETTERRLPNLALEIPALPDGPQLQARPTVATVVLSGARSLVERVDPLLIQLSFSRVAASSISPGEEERVSITVEGVPALVQARVEPEWVLLRRPSGL